MWGRGFVGGPAGPHLYREVAPPRPEPRLMEGQVIELIALGPEKRTQRRCKAKPSEGALLDVAEPGAKPEPGASAEPGASKAGCECRAGCWCRAGCLCLL